MGWSDIFSTRIVKPSPSLELPMTLSERILHLSILLFLVATFAILYPGTARASSLNINVQGDLIDIQADQVPLIDVITGVCEKKGITLKSSDPMREPVSLELKGTPVEICLRRLLARRNYALLYETKGDSQLASVSLRVLGSDPVVTVESEPVAPPPHDPMQRYEKESFSQMLGNSKKLSKQIAADRVEGSWPDGGGVRLTKVSRDSALNKIGLEAGDIVRDVNGQPIESTDDLIEALQSGPREHSMLRIERLRKNGQLDPIYIELH